MPRKSRRRSAAPLIPGLFWRDGAAYWRGSIPSEAGGGRIVKSLGTRDPALAAQYAGVAQTFMDRGDWAVLRRWKAGDLHVGDLVRAVREGDYTRLRRLSAEGPALGPEADRFLARTEATLSDRTGQTYRAAVGLLLEELGRDYPMHQLTVREAERYLHAPKATAGDEVWSARSQAQARTIYGALWKAAAEHEAEECEKRGAVPLLAKNPWRKARIPRQRQTRVEYLTPEEWRHLISHRHVADTPQACFLALAALAGLRDTEATNLRPGVDVDLSAGLIRVQPREGEHAWHPKHDHSVRDVPIVPALRRIIERHTELGFSGERYLIHAAHRDAPISTTTGDDWTERAFTAAGIRYGRRKDALTYHSLRHTFASWLALDGVPFHVIASLMGNTAEIVMKTYAHLSPSDREKAMATIARASQEGA